MIPKIIHYCWFGGNPLPDDARKCINSWKKYCPDYEIREWNEQNFDLNCCEYVAQAYKERKWAFVADYARLYAIVNFGGIYMDSDVEVLKPLDEFLHLEAFSGFQTEDTVPTGIMACEKGYKMFSELLTDYHERSFYREDGSLNTTTNVIYITEKCVEKGLQLNNKHQIVAGFSLYPMDYFCAKSYKTGLIKITQNTYTVHHFAGSWVDEEHKKYNQLRHEMIEKYGYYLGLVIYKIRKELQFY